MFIEKHTNDASSNLGFEWNFEQFEEEFPSIQLTNLNDRSFLYRQGDKCSSLFLIKGGIVKLSHLTAQGNELTFALLRKGDITGCLDIVNADHVMEENAQALGKIDFYRIECNDFKKLITLRTDLSWSVLTSIYARKQQIERKLIATHTQPVRQRVIKMLFELAQLFGARCLHGYALEIFLTQQELADLVGASRSVVSTIMNNFRDQGILNYTREQICINDSALMSIELSTES